jgi:hypothetical protein
LQRLFPEMEYMVGDAEKSLIIRFGKEPWKPLRSLRFVPWHRAPWVERALASGVDGLILDLEAGVPTHLNAQGRPEVVRSITRMRESGAKAAV